MRGEIHPLLAPVGNAALAESLSEQFLHLEEFKASSEEASEAGFTAEDGFPPVPAEPVAMVHAYLEHDNDNNVRRQSLLNPLRVPLRPTFVEDFLHSYKSNIGPLQKLMKEQAKTNPELLDHLRDTAASIARESGLRTVAAFAFMQTVNQENYFGGLLIPRRLFTELPAQHRELHVSLRKLMQEHDIDLGDLLEGRSKEIFQGILQGDAKASNIAFFAGALTLPTIAELTPATKAERPYLFPKEDKPPKTLPPKARRSRGRTTPKKPR